LSQLFLELFGLFKILFLFRIP
jgi:hypothetical protein